MSTSIEGHCDVCASPSAALAVRASSMGPISYAYCLDCLTKGLEPYGGIVAYVFANIEADKHPKECLADWAHAIIGRSLAAAGKSWDDFKADCLAAQVATSY